MEIGAVSEDTPAASVGGVWAIAAVESHEWKVVDKKGNTGKKLEDYPASIVQCNMFEGLLDEEGMLAEVGEKFKEGWPSLEECREVKKHKVGKFKGGVFKNKAEMSGGCQDLASICAVPFASCCGCGPPGLEVCTVGVKRWRTFNIGEITEDSAAEESVCPREWCQEFGTREPVKMLKFVNASGGHMGHYGERTANFKVVGKDSGVMSLNFQVSDVQKPLVAVRRIAEKGNVVQFGPRPEDNYIENKVTGLRINMVKKGGSYVIPAEMLIEEGFQRQAQ
jgi:hypothetical protein